MSTQPSRYRLHYFPESGNSYKLALMLTLCGQPFELVFTDFLAGQTRDPAWRAAVNGMGEIPVLEEDGVNLTQSGAVLVRLAERFGRFGGDTDAERFEVLRWLLFDNHKLTGAAATYRYLRTFAPKPPGAEVMAWLRGRLDAALGVAEVHFRSHDFAIGARATVADLSMCAYLSYPPVELGYDLPASHPAVAAWLGRVAALPGWRAPYEVLPGPRMPTPRLTG